ncbi:glycosyltransferase family protein [Tellurirhabdus bombi]|uniref:glycosyltransferase family protein n=1 Tax=Tellurirhabdus bombi TaxID=2907205 RepID=UPI001F364443|nr:glycosyltransferase family protein [Tellurirhabdus bombi]
MRILFLVQSEGRGHLTQALSLAQIIQEAGHEVIGAFVGITPERAVPTFFRDAFNAPITPVFSPGLCYDSKTNALNPLRTALRAAGNSRALWRSLRQVRNAIDRQRPDVVVNFCELLGGLTYAVMPPSVPLVSIAHHYLAFHPNFQHPKGQWLYRQGFRLVSRLTCLGAREILALSFDRQDDIPSERLRVVPPLLRQEVTRMEPIEPKQTDDFLLAYLTQPGLTVELEKAHRQYPEWRIDTFHAGATAPDQVVDETLTYHAIDGQRFLDFMRRCRAVVTTAGFEAVCEAAYLGKPVLMIPQPNHFEQACNALDGQRVGVGLAAKGFDLKQFMAYLPQHDPQVSVRFRTWQQEGKRLFLEALTRAAAAGKRAKT